MAHNRSIEESFKDLNILTAFGLMAFTVMSLTMLGITGDVVSWMETYQWLPLTGTLAAMVVIFLSSGTRDPSMYHPVEVVFTLLSVALMAGHAFLTEVQNFVAQFDPWGTVVVFVIFVIASAILSR
ncbi:hypothetical protein EGO51_19290 [Haloarcula hispanica]|uniref:Uncharacterized protein n=1 Tax=Haloarcula hispanica TaxID=51589 RepID=A0A5J5LBY8_HALHI|nr:hypothetical protein [Haloarcula hispanica]KAA9404541.1 hypothetical protein EGO51_19290 [Haloarcula hispanica]